MPGRVHRRDTQGTHLQDLPVAEMFGALQAERVQRRVHLFGERPRARGVIGMVVGDQHGADRAGRPRHLVQMRLDVGAGIDDHGGVGPDDPGVGPLQRVDAWVGGQDAEHAQHDQSCQNTERGRRSTSSSPASRVVMCRARSAAALAQVARWFMVK